MPLLKPRSKSVIFRITSEEYESLKLELLSNGARSLSDLARSRVLGARHDLRIEQMGRKLDDLESTVQHLAAVIGSS